MQGIYDRTIGPGRVHLSSEPAPVTAGYYALHVFPQKLRIATDVLLAAAYIVVLLVGRYAGDSGAIYDTWNGEWWAYILAAAESLVAAYFFAVWAILLTRTISATAWMRKIFCCCCAGWCGQRFGTHLDAEKATRSLSGAALSRATLHAVLAMTQIWFVLVSYSTATAAQGLGMLPLYHLACWVVSSRDVAQVEYLTFMHKHHATK